MSSNQEPLEEATLVNQRQQIEQQVEQAAVQIVEQFVQQAPVQTCPTCGRLGFRGARGLAIHRRKNRHCQELCREIQQLPGVEVQAAVEDFARAEDGNTQQEFIIANDVLLDAILVAEAQQVLPIYIVLLVTFRDTVYEFFKGLGRYCLWFLKLLFIKAINHG
ncbi:hypothetical protein INT46_010050 [Mucor plumbeus]|uniref:Uncharacterized protein n=1 Tax=Mucor plumbeus TaxID=97098 RepID=A0A8H7UV55_9FUNG|nr:hypothetical protein INT46_010050 [Mucor plumbeus]